MLELSAAKTDLAKLSEENAMFLGHTNSKQKIHYLGSLKQQIHDLVLENQRLRELLTASNNANNTDSSQEPYWSATAIAQGKNI